MTTDLSALNELDCYYLWAQATIGYADPNANKLGHLRAIALNVGPSISNINQMNALACLRSIVSPGFEVKDTSDMNELDCLREIYSAAYSSPTDTNPSRWNMLACLRGIVKDL